MQPVFPKRFIAPMFASCLFLSACGGGGSSSSSAEAVAPPPPQPSTAPAADTQAPIIVDRTPSDQITEVSINTTIVVEFNESLDAASVDAQSLMVTQQAVPVAGSASYDNTTKSLTFTPDAPLAIETVYGVTVSSSIHDNASNLFLGDNWFFTTGGPFNLGLTTQSTIDQCMDDGDKQMLTLVNNVRAAGQTCGSDDLPAQPLLAWDCMLDQSSLTHSTSMANNDFHEHISPIDGSDPGDRIRAAGYTPQAWGENIAAGYDDEESVMDGWLTSPGHCTNLMSSAFTEMGAADAANATSTFGRYWTQNFGRPQN